MEVRSREDKFDVCLKHEASEAEGYDKPVVTIVIQKMNEDGDYVEVYKTTSGDFEVRDTSVRSGDTAQYRVIYLDEGGLYLDTKDYEVTCQFDGIAVMDDTTVYRTVANWGYDHTRNTSVGFVQPYFKRTPIAIVHGDMNYESGSVTGLFAPFDERGNPVYANQAAYRHKMIDWLANKKPKVVKTMDGYAWKVMVGTGFQDKLSGHVDAQLVTFTWTEIDDLPRDARLKEV